MFNSFSDLFNSELKCKWNSAFAEFDKTVLLFFNCLTEKFKKAHCLNDDNKSVVKCLKQCLIDCAVSFAINNSNELNAKLYLFSFLLNKNKFFLKKR